MICDFTICSVQGRLIVPGRYVVFSVLVNTEFLYMKNICSYEKGSHTGTVPMLKGILGVPPISEFLRSVVYLYNTCFRLFSVINEHVLALSIKRYTPVNKFL